MSETGRVPVMQKWPNTVWVIRHGQSAGNVARDLAEAGGLPTIEVAERDIDVPLSALGHEQARALGQWFARMSDDARPRVLIASPYIRAAQTGRLLSEALAGASSPISLRLDERLREKEFGILDRLTRVGIRSRHPELAEQMTHVGKFYFRPPGGESWCDVILRLRSFLEMLTREYSAERVAIVGHQVIVNCLRYLLERLTEAEILAIDRAADVPNCSVTSYEFDATAGRQGRLIRRLENFVSPLQQTGTPVTAAPDIPMAAKP